MMRQEGPSVEEILQSIKRVMARDEQQLRGGQGAGTGLPEDQRLEPADEDEAEEVRGMAEPPLTGSQEPHAGDGAYAGQAFEEDGFENEHGSPDALTSNTSAAAMRRSLAALELLARGGGGGSGQGDSSLDVTVRDMLRPMLAEWLEANLPAIVERLVRAEITRIAGNRS